MSPGQLAFRARLLLTLWVCSCLGLLWFMDLPAKISTDVLDLIPAGERRPELSLVRSMVSEKQGRVVMLALEVPGMLDGARRSAASDTLRLSLEGSGAFEELVPLAGTGMRDALAKAVYQGRLNQLLPGWLAKQTALWRQGGGQGDGPDAPWLAAQATRELGVFMDKPEAVAFQDLMPSDPLLLLPGLVDRLQDAQMTAPGGDGGPLLFWGLMRGNPMNDKDQALLAASVASAQAAVLEREPGAKLQWTAVARFAEMSRSRIQTEMTRLNILSIVAVFGMAALCLSRVFRSFHLIPPVLISTLSGWCVTLLVFPRVHVLVFVVGSLLAGVAIDYGFYLFMQPPLYPNEPYTVRSRRLIRPLLASALTTILGFSILYFSELPLIRHLGVFVSAGLLAALGSALLWFAQVRDSYLPARPFASASAGKGRFWRPLAYLAIAVCALAALIGPWRLQWHDDIRTLEVASPELHQNDLEVRRLFGEEQGRALYLSTGATVAQAREAWTRFDAWQMQRHPATGVLSLALVIPSQKEWDALVQARTRLAGFQDCFRSSLTAAGYEAEAFDPFFKEWQRWLAEPPLNLDSMAVEFQGRLRGPVALMMSTHEGQAWFASISGDEAKPGDPLPEGTLLASQLATLNQLFADYRASALRLSSIGLGLVGLSVFVLYGLKRGVFVFMIPSGACLGAFGILGLCGQTLNLFHLLGAFLGVCLSHNYAIFSVENKRCGHGVPPSIRMSALSTFASFVVLASSSIPVVAALGGMVSLIVLLALLFVELGAILSRETERTACSKARGSLNKQDESSHPTL